MSKEETNQTVKYVKDPVQRILDYLALFTSLLGIIYIGYKIGMIQGDFNSFKETVGTELQKNEQFREDTIQKISKIETNLELLKQQVNSIEQSNQPD